MLLCVECYLGILFCVLMVDVYELYVFFIFKLMLVEKMKL